MIPNSFNYHKARSVDEALTLLKSHGEDAKLLAGGHSLIPAMKLRLNQPDTLIDIGKIPELNFIKKEGDTLVIGAGTTHHKIAVSDLVKSTVSMLSEGADLIGDVQVRNVGTLGGSIAHADPSADWPALMLASDATIVTKSAEGSRSISASDFFTGFFMTALEENELITEIRIPIPSGNTKSSYKKFMQPASRFAIVGCAAMITQVNGICEAVNVAFTGVSDMAFRDSTVEEALKGMPCTAENIENAANLAAGSVDVLSDHFASVPYRKQLAKVFAKRALMAAC